MSIHRRAARRDNNEAEIVTALETVGALVTRVSGAGQTDLIVAFRGRVYLLEVKARKGRLTPAQEKFYARWFEYVHIVRKVDDALRVVETID